MPGEIDSITIALKLDVSDLETKATEARERLKTKVDKALVLRPTIAPLSGVQVDRLRQSLRAVAADAVNKSLVLSPKFTVTKGTAGTLRKSINDELSAQFKAHPIEIPLKAAKIDGKKLVSSILAEIGTPSIPFTWHWDSKKGPPPGPKSFRVPRDPDDSGSGGGTAGGTTRSRTTTRPAAAPPEETPPETPPAARTRTTARKPATRPAAASAPPAEEPPPESKTRPVTVQPKPRKPRQKPAATQPAESMTPEEQEALDRHLTTETPRHGRTSTPPTTPRTTPRTAPRDTASSGTAAPVADRRYGINEMGARPIEMVPGAEEAMKLPTRRQRAANNPFATDEAYARGLNPEEAAEKTRGVSGAPLAGGAPAKGAVGTDQQITKWRARIEQILGAKRTAEAEARQSGKTATPGYKRAQAMFGALRNIGADPHTGRPNMAPFVAAAAKVIGPQAAEHLGDAYYVYLNRDEGLGDEGEGWDALVRERLNDTSEAFVTDPKFVRETAHGNRSIASKKMANAADMSRRRSDRLDEEGNISGEVGDDDIVAVHALQSALRTEASISANISAVNKKATSRYSGRKGQGKVNPRATGQVATGTPNNEAFREKLAKEQSFVPCNEVLPDGDLCSKKKGHKGEHKASMGEVKPRCGWLMANGKPCTKMLGHKGEHSSSVRLSSAERRQKLHSEQVAATQRGQATSLRKSFQNDVASPPPPDTPRSPAEGPMPSFGLGTPTIPRGEGAPTHGPEDVARSGSLPPPEMLAQEIIRRVTRRATGGRVKKTNFEIKVTDTPKKAGGFTRTYRAYNDKWGAQDVGALELEYNRDKQLEDIYPFVAPFARRQGVATALYSHVAEKEGDIVEKLSDRNAGEHSQTELGHALWIARKRAQGWTDEQIRKASHDTYSEDLDRKVRDLHADAYKERASGGPALLNRLLQATLTESGAIKPGMEGRSQELNKLIEQARGGWDGIYRVNEGNLEEGFLPKGGGPMELLGREERLFVPRTDGEVVPHYKIAHVLNSMPKRMAGGTVEGQPDWLASNIADLSGAAERAGWAPRVADLSRQRLTAKEIAKLLGVDQTSVRAVKAQYGIPSMDDADEFERWAGVSATPSSQSYEDKVRARQASAQQQWVADDAAAAASGSSDDIDVPTFFRQGARAGMYQTPSGQYRDASTRRRVPAAVAHGRQAGMGSPIGFLPGGEPMYGEPQRAKGYLPSGEPILDIPTAPPPPRPDADFLRGQMVHARVEEIRAREAAAVPEPTPRPAPTPREYSRPLAAEPKSGLGPPWRKTRDAFEGEREAIASGGLSSEGGVQRVFVTNWPARFTREEPVAAAAREDRDRASERIKPIAEDATADDESMAGGAAKPRFSSGRTPADVKAQARSAGEDDKDVEKLNAEIQQVRSNIQEKLQLAPVRALSVAFGQISQTLIGGRAGILDRRNIAQAAATSAQTHTNRLQRSVETIDELESRLRDFSEGVRTPEPGEAEGTQQKLEEERRARDTYKTRAEQATKEAAAAEKRILTPGQAVRAQAAGLLGIVGGTLAFTAAMQAAQIGMELITKAVSNAADALTGFAGTTAKTADALAPAAIAVPGSPRAGLAAQYARLGISGDAFPQTNAYATRLAGAQNLSTSIDIMRSEMNLRKRVSANPNIVPGIGTGFENGPLAGIGLGQFGQTPGALQQLGGLFGGIRPSLGSALPGPLGIFGGIANPIVDNVLNSFGLPMSSNPGVRRVFNQAAEQNLSGGINPISIVPVIGPLFDKMSQEFSKNLLQQEDNAPDVQKTVDLMNERISRQIGDTGSLKNNATDKEKQDTIAAFRDAGNEQAGQQLADAGVALVGANGGPATAAIANAIGSAILNVLPSRDELVNMMRPQLAGQLAGIQINALRQRETLLPTQIAVNQIAHPFLAPGTGLTGNVPTGNTFGAGASSPAVTQGTQNLSAIKSQLSSIQGINEALAARGNAWLKGLPPEAQAALASLKALGEESANLQTQMANIQSSFQAEQMSRQYELSLRSAQDLVGLEGKRAETVKAIVGYDAAGNAIQKNITVEASKLGRLQREQMMLSREQSRFELGVSQRQINFQSALAKIQVPGATPAEMAANVAYAKQVAAEAQKRHDFDEKGFRLGTQIQDIGVSRDAMDAIKSLQELTQGQAVTMKTESLQQALELVNQTTGNIQGFVDSFTSEQQNVEQAIQDAWLSTETQMNSFQERYDAVIDAALGDLSTKYASMLTTANGGTPPPAPGPQPIPYDPGDPDRGHATGAWRTGNEIARLHAGEMVIPANQAAWMRSNMLGATMPSSGSGNVTVINFNNPVVRNDSDLDMLARKVEQVMNRRASLVGV